MIYILSFVVGVWGSFLFKFRVEECDSSPDRLREKFDYLVSVTWCYIDDLLNKRIMNVFTSPTSVL